MSTDPIVIIKGDHKRVPALFTKLQHSRTDAHTARALTPDSGNLLAKATVLIKNAAHHTAEERNDWLPTVRAALGRKQLSDIDGQLLNSKKAPRHHSARPGAFGKVARDRKTTSSADAAANDDLILEADGMPTFGLLHA